MGKEAFDKKRNFMRGSLSLHLKKRIVKAFVWNVALNKSETWTLQKKTFDDVRHLKYGSISVFQEYDESIVDLA